MNVSNYTDGSTSVKKYICTFEFGDLDFSKCLWLHPILYTKKSPLRDCLQKQSSVNDYIVSKPEIFFVIRHSSTAFELLCTSHKQKYRIHLPTYIDIYICIWACLYACAFMCIHTYLYVHLYVFWLFKIATPVNQEYPEILKIGL